MPLIQQKKRCLIAPHEAYEIVKDFEQYPKFLPWCSGARLISRRVLDHHQEELIADLLIKYSVFSEVFTTKIMCDQQNLRIDISHLKGPFKKLNSYWVFKMVEGQENQADIEFMIDFSIKFGPLKRVISLFFEEAMKKMISAFEKRFTQMS